MSNPSEKSADVIPIGGNKPTRPVHDIPAFPCHPKNLSAIAEISAFKDLDARAEQCVFAGITAEHREGRALLESCSGAKTIWGDTCTIRLEVYQKMQALLPSDLRKQFRILITETLQHLNADRIADIWRIIFTCSAIFYATIERSFRAHFATRLKGFETQQA